MATGLYDVKPWFVRRLRRIEEWMVARRVSPNTLTWAAVGVSALAGAAIALGGLAHEPLWWLLVPPLAVVRLALNALDGSIARRQGSGSRAGALLNELGDRAADTSMIVPAAWIARPALALGVVAATYLTSLTGVLGTVVDGARLNGGPMGKADRVAVLAFAAGAAAALGTPEAISAGLWVVGGGCVVTIVLRTRTLVRSAGDERA